MVSWIDGIKIHNEWDFPGHPVVKTPWFHCRGHRFDPCLEDPACLMVWPKIEGKKKYIVKIIPPIYSTSMQFLCPPGITIIFFY